MPRFRRCLATLCILQTVVFTEPAGAQEVLRLFRPEQREIQVRDPSQLPKARVPDVPPPSTVSDMPKEPKPYPLSLDDAIRIALANSRVVRLLGGITATSSGRTIYDPAISNTAIDEAQARFDPMLSVENNWSQTETPQGSFDPLDPTRAVIDGVKTDGFSNRVSLSKTNAAGTVASLGVTTTWSRADTAALPLNPETRNSVELSLTQPLLQGGGTSVNLAPIVIARINTERSYFQFKDSVQESVRGVIQGYWSLVFARTDVWARRRQVEQGEEASHRAEARMRAGLADLAEVSQAQSALANFRANLIASESTLQQQEAALRNILGLPPVDDDGQFIPITPPTPERLRVDWAGVLNLAEERRPDIIELKLIIEADEQQLLISRNQAKPRLDAVALYRWNGLEGSMPNGSQIATRGSQFTDWTLGINFSVPLGLRQGRAALRRQELIIERDRANLDQGIHNATHLLAVDVRSLAQFYEQYQAFKAARVAARTNLDRQLENYRRGRTILLNVLQAITDWGNAVSAESQALTRYNTELASLERDTGTILETHGIRFFEERYCSVGPLGVLLGDRAYPESTRPGPNEPKYPSGTEPAENFFDLDDPLKPKGGSAGNDRNSVGPLLGRILRWIETRHPPQSP